MVIDSPIVYNPQNRVKRTGDTMNGELQVQYSDLVAGDVELLKVEGLSDGSQFYNDAGLYFGLFDANIIIPGLGKIPYINAFCDGLAGDGSIILPPTMYLFNIVGGEPSIVALGGTPGALMYLNTDYDWDGLGSNRWEASDDFYVGGDLDVTGTFTCGTFAPASLTIGDAGNAPPTILTFVNSFGSSTIEYGTNSTDTFTVSATNLDIESALRQSGVINNNIVLVGSDAQGIQINPYSNTPDATHEGLVISHGGSCIASTGAIISAYNMADPGLVFRVGAYGDLTLGSVTPADYDVVFKMQGKTTNGTIQWLESEGGLFDIVGLANFNNGLFASGSSISVEAGQNLVLNYGTDTTYLQDSGSAFVFGNANSTFLFNGMASSDVAMQFSDSGTTSTGEFIWRISDELFEFSNDILATTYVYFRDTSSYIYDDGTDLLIESDGDVKITTDCNVTGELLGCRQIITGGNQGAVSANAYQIMGVGGTRVFTSTFGWVMPRAGSIVGISTILNITVETVQGDIVIQSRINDNVKLSVTVNSGGAGAAVKKGYATQARGTDAFSAGDLIQIYTKLDTNTFAGTITGIATIVEVVFDT